ncbi:DUF1643 domain-containing protein [Achromobacter xylosoxidans]|uniref:DUF1643 domain-containing protein n=1 Tax=Achromobacter anxifer TaxID=1287737 RepID=UPI00155CDADC|nr:DUF1643 domain-containing protein [Achromobacter anxifer]CAB5514568.1 hypothetical protein LMG26857_03627 [Achromobacter anxifer]
MTTSLIANRDVGLRAAFSPCGRFRYQLLDVWDPSKPILPWILFNPSVAGQAGEGGATISDPTARKGRGFSERHGFGGMLFTNLFAYISTDPAGLKAAGYQVGPDNDRYILEACAAGDGRVVCAWGALGRKLARAEEVGSMVRRAGYRPMAFGFTDDGLPRHPLMLAYSTPLVPYDVA